VRFCLVASRPLSVFAVAATLCSSPVRAQEPACRSGATALADAYVLLQNDPDMAATIAPLVKELARLEHEALRRAAVNVANGH